MALPWREGAADIVFRVLVKGGYAQVVIISLAVVCGGDSDGDDDGRGRSITTYGYWYSGGKDLGWLGTPNWRTSGPSDCLRSAKSRSPHGVHAESCI